MTRATLYCVTDKKVIRSAEYNGDRYPEGWGIFYIHLLEKTRNEEDFIIMIQEFQYKHFNGYDCDSTFSDKKSTYFNKKGQMVLNDDNYFEDYFSDWIFIKNISSNPFAIITRDGDLKILDKGEQIALNYGHTKGAFGSAEECRKVHEMECGFLDECEIKSIIEASGQ